MSGELQTSLTILSNFLCSALALWFALYLMSRSRANPLTFRAVVALLALALFYWGALWAMLKVEANTGPVRSLAIIIALTALHDLTHYLLPDPTRKKTYWVARGIVIFNVAAITLLFGLSDDIRCSPVAICPVNRSVPELIIGAFETFILLAILFNLWVIRKNMRSVYPGFFWGVLFGVSTVAYGLLGTLLDLPLPRFVANSLVLAALLLWGYSVARHQMLVERRFTLYDLPVLVLTAIGIAGFYMLVTWQLGLEIIEILLISLLAVFTHSIYDLVREQLERVFRSQEHQLRRQVRELSRTTSQKTPLKSIMRKTLAILCHNLQATSGFVAVRHNGKFLVITSFHSLPVDTILPIEESFLESVSPASGTLAKKVAWLSPAIQGGAMVAIVGLGQRKGPQIYSEDDLNWLEEITEEIGSIVYMRQLNMGILENNQKPDEDTPDTLENQKAERDLLSSLMYQPSKEQIKAVEESFRNIYDFSRLGRSNLTNWFNLDGRNTLERGKQVQQRILSTLEQLRPPGKAPKEPYPREWYSYTILHDAYVLDVPARDIMGKLFISEGTYYRLRRKALRVVTRALLEAIPTN